MTTKQLIPQQESGPNRVLRLRECEKIIADACRRTIQESRVIGEQLRIISDQELWQEKGSTSMTDYVETELPFDRHAASRMMLFSHIADIFDQNKLALPAYETQALELAKLRDDEGNLLEKELIHVWQKLQATCEKRGDIITTYAVKQAVLDFEETHDRESGGVQVNLDDGQQAAGPPSPAGGGGSREASTTAQAPRIRLTEDGENALERIGRLCGPEIAKAIESGTVRISQADLITWAEQDDQMVKNLVYYVIDNRWSVPKAIKYENRTITGATTIDELILMCQSRGGRITFDHDTEEFTVRVTLELT
jgi:hypothetical protein